MTLPVLDAAQLLGFRIVAKEDGAVLSAKIGEKGGKKVMPAEAAAAATPALDAAKLLGFRIEAADPGTTGMKLGDKTGTKEGRKSAPRA